MPTENTKKDYEENEENKIKISPVKEEEKFNSAAKSKEKEILEINENKKENEKILLDSKDNKKLELPGMLVAGYQNEHEFTKTGFNINHDLKLEKEEKEKKIPIYKEILKLHEKRLPIGREADFCEWQLKILKEFDSLSEENKTKNTLEAMNHNTTMEAKKAMIKDYESYLKARAGRLSENKDKFVKISREEITEMLKNFAESLDDWVNKRSIFILFPNLFAEKYEQLPTIISQCEARLGNLVEEDSRLMDEQEKLTSNLYNTENQYRKTLLEELMTQSSNADDTFIHTCFTGDTKAVEKFIKEKNISIDSLPKIINQDGNKCAALSIACAKGDEKLVKWLLENGADTEKFDRTNGFHTLHYIAASGDVKIMKLVQEYREKKLGINATIDIVDRRIEQSRLEKCHVEIQTIDSSDVNKKMEEWGLKSNKGKKWWNVLLLLGKGETVNIAYFERGVDFKIMEINAALSPWQEVLKNIKTSLGFNSSSLSKFFSPPKLKLNCLYKFEEKNKEIFNLVNTIIDVYNMDSYCRTPLSTAIFYGKFNVAQWLLDKKANVNSVEKFHGNSILHMATKYPLIVNFLLSQPMVDVGLKNNNKERPILTAALCSDETFAVFLKHGIFLNKEEQEILKKKHEKQKRIKKENNVDQFSQSSSNSIFSLSEKNKKNEDSKENNNEKEEEIQKKPTV